VNFCVTEKGLEDQLLALVVEHERPDLQEQAQNLVKQLGEFTITLKSLEDNLLTRLANSQGDILEDIKLIENLEETKRTAVRSPFTLAYACYVDCYCAEGIVPVFTLMEM
jgi:dynein heavy chain, axonemal